MKTRAEELNDGRNHLLSARDALEAAHAPAGVLNDLLALINKLMRFIAQLEDHAHDPAHDPQLAGKETPG